MTSEDSKALSLDPLNYGAPIDRIQKSIPIKDEPDQPSTTP